MRVLVFFLCWIIAPATGAGIAKKLPAKAKVTSVASTDAMSSIEPFPGPIKQVAKRVIAPGKSMVYTIPMTGIAVTNGSKTAPVRFALQDRELAWSNYELDAGADGIFPGMTHIAVATKGQKPLVYPVSLGNRYSVFWNTSKSRWEVNRMALK
jgi:hypothetical protein